MDQTIQSKGKDFPTLLSSSSSFNDTTTCCLWEIHFRLKDFSFKQKNLSHANSNSKKSGVAILMLDKIGFKTKGKLENIFR